MLVSKTGLKATALAFMALSAAASQATCTFDPLPNATEPDLHIECADDPVSSATSAQAITSVPLPTAVWLLGSGLIGLAGVARRRHS